MTKFCDSDVANNIKVILSTIPNNNYLKLNICNRLILSSGWDMEGMKNNDYHMIFCKQGKGNYFIDDEGIVD